MSSGESLPDSLESVQRAPSALSATGAFEVNFDDTMSSASSRANGGSPFSPQTQAHAQASPSYATESGSDSSPPISSPTDNFAFEEPPITHASHTSIGSTTSLQSQDSRAPSNNAMTATAKFIPPSVDIDDPFAAHELQQQKILRANSFELSPTSKSRSLTATAIAPKIRASAQSDVYEEKQQQPSSQNDYTRTAPRQQQQQQQQPIPSPPTALSPAQTEELIASLSTLSSSELREKSSRVQKLIAQFDSQFLMRDPSTGQEKYPAWCIPFVEEMAKKFDTILMCQHRAEEKEEVEAEKKRWKGAHQPSSIKFAKEAEEIRIQLEEREGQRREERLAAKFKVDQIERIKAAQQAADGNQTQQLNSQQQQQQFSRTQQPHQQHRGRPRSAHLAATYATTGDNFYPDELYYVGMNAQLPFLRDHGNFGHRRHAAHSGASPRRNLHGQEKDHNLEYLSASARAIPRTHGPMSAQSQAYLTGLMGRDINASTLNRLMRSTMMSPTRRFASVSPPKRPSRPSTVQYEKEPPGPTFPKANRFSSTYSQGAGPYDHLYDPYGLHSGQYGATRSGGSGSRSRKKTGSKSSKSHNGRSGKDRDLELEVEALRLKLDDVMDQLDEQGRPRVIEHHHHERKPLRKDSFISHSQSPSQSPLHSPRSPIRSPARSPRRGSSTFGDRSASASPSASPRNRKLAKSGSKSKLGAADELLAQTVQMHGHAGMGGAGSGFDEDEFANALIRIGEANREKFLLLVSQIANLQDQMLKQQEKMNQMNQSSTGRHAFASADGSGYGSAAGANGEDDPFGAHGGGSSHSASSASGSHSASNASVAQLQSDLNRLQRELDQTLREKQNLTSELRKMQTNQDKNKFGLMEQVLDLSSNSSDMAKKHAQDQMLIKAYEEDLRSSRDAITSLQGMIRRENEVAKALAKDKQNLEKKLDKLDAILLEKSNAEKNAAYKAGQSSLKPGQKFASFMHKYLAAFYRKEFQNLLAEKSKSLNQIQKIEDEIGRAKERHELEMTYAHKTHENIMNHLSTTLAEKSNMTNDLQNQLDEALEKQQLLQMEKDKKEQDLLATEMLNQQLQSALSNQVHTIGENDFTTLMTDSFKGDYLNSRNDTQLLKIVYGLGDEKILFSDYVQRIDRHNKYQKRIFLITDHHMLCLWADRGRSVRRVIKIDDLRFVTLSRQSADLFVLHYADEYDYLLISSKRSEVMYHLMNLIQTLSRGSKTLKYKFGERVYVRDRDHMHRDIHVDTNAVILGSRTVRPISEYDEDGEQHNNDY